MESSLKIINSYEFILTFIFHISYWFRSYLINRKQFCKVNGVLSDIKDIDVGVSQGSRLGPLLFLLYINDLPFALKKAETNMYADDTMISYSHK